MYAHIKGLGWSTWRDEYNFDNLDADGSTVKMDITKLGREGMNWFYLAEDGGQSDGLL